MGQLQEQSILPIVLLGTAGIIVLVISIAFFILIYQRRMLREKKLRVEQELEFQSRMIKAQLESEERERKRIASDLHDSLGSLLWGAKVNASFIQRTVTMNEETTTTHNELTQILDEGIELVRRIAWELSPQAFHYSGLSESIKRICERFDGKGLEVSFQEEGRRLWNDDRALQVFRVVQELISNSIRHAQASKLTIELNWQDAALLISVADDGIGFKQNGHKGVGLWNIDQRINQLGGELRIGHPPMSSGTAFNLTIPLSS